MSRPGFRQAPRAGAVKDAHSAACRPQPKAAIPRQSRFDLESWDLQPDDRVNHSDGAAMNGFVDLHGESVTGVINTFDRVIFKGHLNGFFPDGAFGRYLSRRSVLLKDAGRFFETQRIRDHVVSLAAAAGRISGGSQHASLGHLQGGPGAGHCRAGWGDAGVRAVGGRALPLVRGRAQPADPAPGGAAAQVPALLPVPDRSRVRVDACAAADPYEIQVYVNEWLARQLDAAAIGYRRSDNKIIAVDDPAAVAALGERFAHTDWLSSVRRPWSIRCCLASRTLAFPATGG
jgi:hypothetical protein